VTKPHDDEMQRQDQQAKHIRFPRKNAATISFPSSTLIFQIQIIQTGREAPSFGTSLFKIFPASADHISVLTKVICLLTV
jgi:hypothetical protein